MTPKLFATIIITVICLFYVGLVLWRKRRYRHFTKRIAGEYHTKGWFDLGEVHGTYKGREFHFSTKKNVGPLGSMFSSAFTMATAYTGKTITI